MKSIKLGLFIALSTLVACSNASNSVQSATTQKSFSSQSPIQVTATIGMITDAVKNIGGDFVNVTGLMGPGVDPHLYKASQGDIRKLANADIIFYNGLNLEGKMGDIFVKMARTRPVVAVTDSVDVSKLREPPEFLGHYDPHLWFDVSLWTQVLQEVRNGLVALDPKHRDVYQKNEKKYRNELIALHKWTKETLAKVPAKQRVMITAHDAFGYFGRAYDIEVVGLQGVSTVAEFGLKDVQRIVDLLVKRNIKAVFVESSIPKRSIEAVVAGARGRGHDVIIGGELFSDAMGAAGTEEGTYIGMVRANVETVANALVGNKVAHKK